MNIPFFVFLYFTFFVQFTTHASFGLHWTAYGKFTDLIVFTQITKRFALASAAFFRKIKKCSFLLSWCVLEAINTRNDKYSILHFFSL